MRAEKAGGGASDGWPIPNPEALENQTSRGLVDLFESGAFDAIAKRLGEALVKLEPEVSTFFHLNFSLTFTEFRLRRELMKTRLRNLGNLVVLNDRDRAHIEVGITPATIDDTTPCAACGGSGITITNPVSLEELPPRPFGTLWRKLF